MTHADVQAASLLLQYAEKDFFIDPHLGALQAIDRLRGIPITLVHGRYDMDCRVSQAFLLKDKLPHVDLRVVAGNHSPAEEPMRTAILKMLSDALL